MGAKPFVHAACAAAAAAALCTIPERAAADAARAWAAARDNVPAQAALVIGADLSAITKSQTFHRFLPLALAKDPEVRKLFETIKTSCKIDPLTAIQGVVYATDADRKHGAVYVSLGAGLDQAKLTKCFEEVAKASGAKDAKLTVKKTGAITEVTIDKDKARDKAYVSWIGSDVLVIPSDLRDRAVLEKWIGKKGGLARSPLAKLHASANTKGVVWGASAIAKELDPGLRMKSAHGALTMAGKNLVLDLSTTLDSAKAAADAVVKANAQIALVVGTGQLPPTVKTMLQQVSIKSSGPVISIKATVAETELLGLLTMIGP
jgi:hypothetical protein